IGQLFGVRAELRTLAERHHALTPVYECRRRFVQRKALRQIKAAEAAGLDGAALEGELAGKLGEAVTELAFARHVNRWQDEEAAHADDLTLAARYAAWATLTEAGRARHPQSVLFKTPALLDPMHFIPHLHTDSDAGYAVHRFDVKHLRRRAGFSLTDAGTDLAGALSEIH